MSPMPHEIKRQGQAHTQANLLRHAYRYSSFWRQRLARAGFDFASAELFELTRLPVLARQDLQESFEEMREARQTRHAVALQVGAYQIENSDGTCVS